MHRTYLIAASIGAFVAGPSMHASDLFGIEFSGLTDLFRINQTSGLATSVGPTGRDNLGDLTSDTRPGSERIWSIRTSANQLFQLDPITGAAGPAVALDSPNSMVSIAFDPVGGKLYGNTSVGFGAPFDALYEINPTTGATTFLGRILFDNVYALGFDQSGDLFGVSDATDDLIGINTTTGTGTFIADLGVGFAFDLASRPEDDAMFLADSGTFHLYTVNTSTGALTDIGAYGSSLNVVGLAFLPTSDVPEASTYLAGGVLMLGIAGARFIRRRRA